MAHHGEDRSRLQDRCRLPLHTPTRIALDERPLFTWHQYPTWDVFASEGEFLGTVELPYDTRPVFMTREYIWTIQPNEDEKDVAVRYRIEGLGGS